MLQPLADFLLEYASRKDAGVVELARLESV